MKMNLWSMKTGLSVFAIVVVGVVLFDHRARRRAWPSRPSAAAAAQPRENHRG